MEYILLWCIFGVVAGMISSGRGQGFNGGCLWGILLGPIGILIALLYTPNAATVERQQLVSGNVKKCPQCAEMIKVDAKVCRFCGYTLPVIDASAAMVSYGMQYMKENPGLEHLEGLRNNMLKRGYEAPLVDRVVAEVKAKLT